MIGRCSICGYLRFVSLSEEKRRLTLRCAEDGGNPVIEPADAVVPQGAPFPFIAEKTVEERIAQIRARRNLPLPRGSSAIQYVRQAVARGYIARSSRRSGAE